MRLLRTRRSFKKEFRRQLRLAIIAAVGFTVAFSWRNAVYNSSKKIIEILTKSTQLIINELLTALFITLLSVLLLFFTSKLLREK